MPVIETISAIAVAVPAIIKAVGEVGEALEKAFERYTIIDVENHTNLVLRKIVDSHLHGGFKIPPNSVVGPDSANVFGSGTTGFMTGNQGVVEYETEDSLGLLYVRVNWDNPFVGGNSCTARVFRVLPGLSKEEVANLGGPAAVRARALLEAFRSGLGVDATDYVVSASITTGNHCTAKYLITRR